MDGWIELERDGVRLACRDFGGSGPAVLFLSGLAGHSGEWELTAARLTGSRRVLALDQRGHGRSERNPTDLSREAFVADVAHTIERLQLGAVALTGQSMGANTAFLTAAAHPELVERLVVAEASPDGPLPELASSIQSALRAWPVPFGSRADAIAYFRSRGSDAETWADGLRKRDGLLWPAFEIDVMVAIAAALGERSWWPEWRQIRCPTLIVVGESGVISASHAEAMATAIGPARVVSIAGAGHDVHLDASEAWYEALEAFL
ncbi:MAG TPA: alpha/beta hydrolase [Solirubrobacteraceae bacterium]|jgi:pimeloyl-ACP methyl ester carboxylesterase|nr:alpha/beta hydrolase [Solirubrobacteraceae bacterium]